MDGMSEIEGYAARAPSDHALAAPDVPTDDPLIMEAHERWNRCSEYESTAHQRAIADYKFAFGDSDNGYQWPDAIKRNRDVDKRPCLTLNITRQHNKQIVNEQLKNKRQVKIRAAGGEATAESAQLWQALIDDIQYKSNAQAAYARASDFQVTIGWGYWRLATDYVSDDSFDQEIRILGVEDPLRVYLDPNAKDETQPDLGAEFAFVFDVVPNDKLREAYPEIEGIGNLQPLNAMAGDSDWIMKDHTRVAEYFRKVHVKDELASFIDPASGVRKSLLRSLMPADVWAGIKDLPTTKIRPTKRTKVEWYLIVGNKQVDHTIWPGSYIPLVRIIGEETNIQGVMDRKGHTRYMKDAQRMYNYNASAQVEQVALQTKVPWIAAAKAIEEYESMWNTANVVNHSVLIYNDVDPEYPEHQIPPPQRIEPPASSPGFAEGMQTAFNQMMMTSGQWQNQMGMIGNERTGAAIRERQAQSDTSVFHFQNNFEQGLRNCGKMLLELIPKVYDTQRLMRLRLDSGDELDVELNPATPQALQQITNANGKIVASVLNLTKGQFEVIADVGAAYGTRREETVQALTLILTQAPELVQYVGDLLLSSMDFDKAQEAAQRLRNMIPPQALGKGPSPQEQQLMQHNQQLQVALSKVLDRMAKEQLKLVGKDQMRDIDAYKAHTDRIKALAAMLPTEPNVLAELIEELGNDTMSETLRPLVEANRRGLIAQAGDTEIGGSPAAAAASAPPIPGARQAPDGQWYVPDPTRQGKFLRVRSGGGATNA